MGLTNEDLDYLDSIKDTFKVGEYFVTIAVKILREEGFSQIEVSKRNKPYDLIAEKNSIKYCIEVKGLRRKNDKNKYNWTFNINNGKFYRLKEINKPILFLLINLEGYALIRLEDLISNKNNFSINGKHIVIGRSRKEDWESRPFKGKGIRINYEENEMLDKLKVKLGIEKKKIVNRIIREYYSKEFS
jgi:Holliday junction resolvase-like predicted endonuclease